MENTAEIQERRTSDRQRMLKSGTVSPDGRLTVFDCVVKNMSETGARIKVQAQQSIPNELIFMLKGSTLKADAKVIWRHEKEIGLQFITG